MEVLKERLLERVCVDLVKEVNAEAVAFVFNEAFEKNFVHVHLLEGLEEVTADDELTVTFHFEKPFAALLSNLSHRSLVIFSPTAYKEHGEEWMATNLVGTGPFVQEELVRGEYLKYRKNERYWQEGKPYLDRVTIRIVPDMSVRSGRQGDGAPDVDGNPYVRPGDKPEAAFVGLRKVWVRLRDRPGPTDVRN